MISLELFTKIKDAYGDVCSWAVWDKVGDTPKSNMGNMDVLDPDLNPNLLNVLHTDVVMIGLNFSRDICFDVPFRNFHDPSPCANDFKIRYAFQDTYYYGAYMTDLIKNTIVKSSKELLSYLQTDKSVIQDNIVKLQDEFRDIETKRPIILAFGRVTFELLEEYLPKDNYSTLIKLIHYSHYISKEDYKEQSLNVIGKNKVANT